MHENNIPVTYVLVKIIRFMIVLNTKIHIYPDLI